MYKHVYRIESDLIGFKIGLSDTWSELLWAQKGYKVSY